MSIKTLDDLQEEFANESDPKARLMQLKHYRDTIRKGERAVAYVTRSKRGMEDAAVTALARLRMVRAFEEAFAKEDKAKLNMKLKKAFKRSKTGKTTVKKYVCYYPIKKGIFGRKKKKKYYWTIIKFLKKNGKMGHRFQRLARVTDKSGRMNPKPKFLTLRPPGINKSKKLKPEQMFKLRQKCKKKGRKKALKETIKNPG